MRQSETQNANAKGQEMSNSKLQQMVERMNDTQVQIREIDNRIEHLDRFGYDYASTEGFDTVELVDEQQRELESVQDVLRAELAALALAVSSEIANSDDPEAADAFVAEALI